MEEGLPHYMIKVDKIDEPDFRNALDLQQQVKEHTIVIKHFWNHWKRVLDCLKRDI